MSARLLVVLALAGSACLLLASLPGTHLHVQDARHYIHEHGHAGPHRHHGEDPHPLPSGPGAGDEDGQSFVASAISQVLPDTALGDLLTGSLPAEFLPSPGSEPAKDSPGTPGTGPRAPPA